VTIATWILSWNERSHVTKVICNKIIFRNLQQEVRFMSSMDAMYLFSFLYPPFLPFSDYVTKTRIKIGYLLLTK